MVLRWGWNWRGWTPVIPLSSVCLVSQRYECCALWLPSAAFLNEITCTLALVVRQIQGYRVRLHFDGYPECYDFWANADSWDLKPAGWCEKNGHKLLLPKGNEKLTWSVFGVCPIKPPHWVHFIDCKDGEFNWSMYVKNCRGQLAPKHLFKSLNTVRLPHNPSSAQVQVQPLKFLSFLFILVCDSIWV